MSDFGTYLRTLRDTRGLSRPQLRDLVRDRFNGDSFSTSSIDNWERGVTYPSAVDLAKLVVVLGADWDEVFRTLVAETRPGDDPGRGASGRAAPPRRPSGGRGGSRRPRSGNGSDRR